MSEEGEEGKEEEGAGQSSGGDCKCEEGGGAPEWMATFADLVTLLMCFFVLLFAMSSTQQETFKELVKSLRSALGVQQIPEAGTREGLMLSQAPSDSKTEEDIEAVDEIGGMVQKELDSLISEVNELIMFNRLQGMVRVSESEQGATITLSDMILFPPGKIKMSKEGQYVLKQVAQILRQFNYRIKVSGHTDNAPYQSKSISSNWELSSLRACEVVRLLIKLKVNPAQLSAVGYAHYHPISTNDNEEGRAENRRVEITYDRQSIESAFK